MKSIRIHPKVGKEIAHLEPATRLKLTEFFSLLGGGESLGMPLSRPMPIVEHGAHELRIKDARGHYRFFYYTKVKDAILIFHFFKKKTETTPAQEIATGQKRLKEMIG